MFVWTKFTISGRMGTVKTAGRVVDSLAEPSVPKTDTTGRADMAALAGTGRVKLNPGKMTVSGRDNHKLLEYQNLAVASQIRDVGDSSLNRFISFVG